MKYYIIAGEASGDLHGSNLIKHIFRRDKNARVRGWGGDKMKNEGMDVVKHINDLAFMGFVEVAKNIRIILNNIKFCKKDIVEFQPDVVIFIDYPGFNLRIAEFVKKTGIKTLYYISPQLWAWNRARVKKIKRDVDKMLVILPFEKDFYAQYNFGVEFVGHPLLDALEKYQQAPENTNDFRNRFQLGDKPLVALLPGSRKQEISTMLKTMTDVSQSFPSYQFVIAGTSAHSKDFYYKHTQKKEIPVLFDHTYELLQHAEGALVTSGTATLETALIGVPELVCYKAGKVSYEIAKRLIKVEYISLVNLIMDQLIVKEMIQNDFTVDKLAGQLEEILENRETRQLIKENYSKLRAKLGGTGASEKAAESVIKFAQK